MKNRFLSLHLIFVFSGIHCINDTNDEESHRKFSSAIDGPISTPEDLFTLDDGKDIPQKLIRLLTDAEYREVRNAALKTMVPNKDPLMPRVLDDDLLDLIPDISRTPKVHIHHVFPPHLIRPLQRVIIQKMIEYIKRDPIRHFKRKVKRVSRLGTVAVGLGLGINGLKEIKSHPPMANYHVTGVVDLSGQKKNTYQDDEYQERYKRSLDHEDRPDDPGYIVKDYKLVPDRYHHKSKHELIHDFKEKIHSKHYWPFHESKEEIYEKWNKFPAPSDPDPFHHKVKHIHRSFHELHPELLHIVKDVHGLAGSVHKEKIFPGAPDLEHPIVLAGQLIKLADSLIPSIRIRIPFLEYLKKSFHEKSKPKVIYVKQRPNIEYVGLPYKEEVPVPMPVSEPIQINVQSVPVPEPVIVQTGGNSGSYDPGSTAEVSEGYRRHMPSDDKRPNTGNYELITNLNVNEQGRSNQPRFFTGGPSYDSKPPVQHKYTQFFEEAARVYQDKKGARA